ncbi:MAG: hypothetical protein A3E88_03665 [Legionellales bacterium RIFCSPHIGHO2_12_FULL_35_11]|nr:MAG: hypothetical protein A3E88_03665 [Legionellales bacterium RIFCSPHIGHO2_12_FULL_35_11]
MLRSEFTLNHEVSRPEVQRRIRWIIAHPEYLQKLSKAEPFIYHITNEVKKRNLPGELALMPMIESTFNPFAYSRAGASGLWQIMPGTGRDFGLKQNWWSDSRRSVRNSTKAALHYLNYLHNYFRGNWTLAIAAYDAGEGSVARIINQSNKNKYNASFWTLPLPLETKSYVPKLYALAEIIQNPTKYHVTLPHIDHKPYFEEVNVGSQIDLTNAAHLAGISYQELIKLNPEHNRSATSPYAPYNLLIPVNKVTKFKQNLAELSKDKKTSLTRHKISSGDNLQKLAKLYSTSPLLLKEINKLKSSKIKKDQYLLVPDKNNKANLVNNSHFITPKYYKVVHIVSNADTYNSLQTKYEVSPSQLKMWNEKLALTGKLLPGQPIIIWKKTKTANVYKVKPGDSLSTIAVNHNKNLKTLLQLNPNLKTSHIKSGQEIRLS